MNDSPQAGAPAPGSPAPGTDVQQRGAQVAHEDAQRAQERSVADTAAAKTLAEHPGKNAPEGSPERAVYETLLAEAAKAKLAADAGKQQPGASVDGDPEPPPESEDPLDPEEAAHTRANDLQQRVGQDLNAAGQLASTALAIGLGSADKVVDAPERSGRLIPLVLAHVPSVGPWREAVQDLLGRALEKRAGQILPNVGQAALEGLAHALMSLGVKTGGGRL